MRTVRLTREGLDRLLAVLHVDRTAAVEEYLKVWKRLVKFFEWERVSSPEDCADETVDRICRHLEEGREIRKNVRDYCFGVARNVAREERKSREVRVDVIDFDVPTQPVEPPDDEEPLLACYDKCLEELSDNRRALILRYYEGERRTKIDNRQRIADEMGIGIVALATRASRIRAEVKECVTRCLEKH